MKTENHLSGQIPKFRWHGRLLALEEFVKEKEEMNTLMEGKEEEIQDLFKMLGK